MNVTRFVLIFIFGFAFASISFAQSNIGNPVKIPPPVVINSKAQQTLPIERITIVSQSGGELYFDVEIADDNDERRIGMMYRTEVPDNTGMLFIFDDVAERRFWMKNTLVALDLLFITEDGVVHSIQHNAEPESLRLLESHGAVKAVLEIGGNVAAEKGIDVGDRVIYEFPVAE